MLGIHNTSLQLQRVGMLTLDIHAALSYGFLEANMDFFKKKIIKLETFYRTC